MTSTPTELVENSARDEQSPPVRIQMIAPEWSDCFPGRWEDVSDGKIRLSAAKPVPAGSVVSIRTRSLLIRGRIQRCEHLNQEYLADASVVEVSPLGHTSPVSRETAGLVRLLLAVNRLRGTKVPKRKMPKSAVSRTRR
jgi:hypothetical protein